MGRTRWFQAVLLVVGGLLLSLLTAGPVTADPGDTRDRAAATLPTKHCTGYSGCDRAGYGNAGYAGSSGTSYWRQYAGHNCTNYVAYRLIRNGASASYGPFPDGGAAGMGPYFQDRGVRVDGTPAVGAMAWWRGNANPWVGATGHVAYVERVNSNGSITVSEDNYGGDFDWRTYPRGTYFPSGFIHLRDVSTPPVPSSGATTLTAERNLDGRLEVYGVGRNGKFYKRHQESAGGRFTDWYEWGGSTTPGSSVTSAINKDGRIEVYVVGSDGSAYKRYQGSPGGRFNDWYKWGGSFAPGTTLTAERNLDGRLEVYGVGRDGQALKRYQESAGSTFVDWYGWGGSFNGG